MSMFGFGQKELDDISKYEQDIPIQRVDMNTGLDKYVKRKESDYKRDVTRDNPWRYDMSINLDAKVMHEEADDYFRKNIPYVARQLDNTEYYDQLMYGITKEYGLSKFKEVVDNIIHKINPMNVYDEEGNAIPIGKGGYGSGDISNALMSHFDYERVLSDENKQELSDYWEQKHNPYTKDLPQGDTMGAGDFR